MAGSEGGPSQTAQFFGLFLGNLRGTDFGRLVLRLVVLVLPRICTKRALTDRPEAVRVTDDHQGERSPQPGGHRPKGARSRRGHAACSVFTDYRRWGSPVSACAPAVTFSTVITVLLISSEPLPPVTG